MGFALWIDGDVACAQGTHEYRPMGVAFVGVRTRFTARDFRPLRLARSRDPRTFEGFFASIGHLNEYLEKRMWSGRRSQVLKKKLRTRKSPSLPCV